MTDNLVIPTLPEESAHKKGIAGNKLAILLVGLVGVVLVFIAGFFAISAITQASDSAPKDMVINGTSANSTKISWTTDQETQGVVEYGLTPTNLNLFAPETNKTKMHTIELQSLLPNSSYYFQIRIGDKKYDNGGVPWTFATRQKVEPTILPLPSPTQTAATPSATPTNMPTPTRILTPLPTSTPRPTSTPLPTQPIFACGETDCQKICQKVGTTCSTNDWVKSGCIGKVALGSCVLITPTPSPTITPTPSATPVPTATPTPTPSPT